MIMCYCDGGMSAQSSVIYLSVYLSVCLSVYLSVFSSFYPILPIRLLPIQCVEFLLYVSAMMAAGVPRSVCEHTTDH